MPIVQMERTAEATVCIIKRGGQEMDKLVRKIEVPLAKKAVSDAGLCIAGPKDLQKLAEIAMDAYEDYPLHNWFTNGRYDREASKRIMEVSLRTMEKDGVIYADSVQPNGFAAWLPLGFTGSKTIPFLTHGGLKLILHCGPQIIGKLLSYETYAMNLKKKYTKNVDWYLYNLSLSPKDQGKGIATKLLRPMLDFCDRENMVCYLETNKESNVSLYTHFGFRLEEQGIVPGSSVMHYAMTRTPGRKVLGATERKGGLGDGPFSS